MRIDRFRLQPDRRMGCRLVGVLALETLVVILPAIETLKPYSFNYIVNHNLRI